MLEPHLCYQLSNAVEYAPPLSPAHGFKHFQNGRVVQRNNQLSTITEDIPAPGHKRRSVLEKPATQQPVC